MTGQTALKQSLRDQPRRLGAHQARTIQWEVPAGWNTEVLELSPGQNVPLTVNITSVDDGVYVDVHGSVELTGHCVRCLDPVAVPVEIEGGELYSEPERAGKKKASEPDDPDIDIEGDEFDPDFLIEQDTVDLEPLLRDAIFVDAPFQPVCDEECMGICEHCGIRLRDAEPGHAHEFLDPRFAALQVLLDAEEEREDG